MEDPKEDAREFGEGVWIYCNQHLRPHQTGWCTVSNRNKTKLEFTPTGDHQLDARTADDECRRRGLPLYPECLKDKS